MAICFQVCLYRPIFPIHARVIPLINGCFWSNHVKKGNNWKICWLLGHKNFYRKIMKWKKKVSVFIWCMCLFMQLLRLCFFKSALLMISQQWIFMIWKKIDSTLNVYFGCLSSEWVDNPVICLCTIKMLCVYNVHNGWMVCLIR